VLLCKGLVKCLPTFTKLCFNLKFQLDCKMNSLNDDRGRELDELRTKLMKENHFLKSLASKPLSVYFDAYRTKAYDGGGEENLTFQVKFTVPNIEN